MHSSFDATAFLLHSACVGSVPGRVLPNRPRSAQRPNSNGERKAMRNSFIGLILTCVVAAWAADKFQP